MSEDIKGCLQMPNAAKKFARNSRAEIRGKMEAGKLQEVLHAYGLARQKSRQTRRAYEIVFRELGIDKDLVRGYQNARRVEGNNVAAPLTNIARIRNARERGAEYYVDRRGCIALVPAPPDDETEGHSAGDADSKSRSVQRKCKNADGSFRFSLRGFRVKKCPTG